MPALYCRFLSVLCIVYFSVIYWYTTASLQPGIASDDSTPRGKAPLTQLGISSDDLPLTSTPRRKIPQFRCDFLICKVIFSQVSVLVSCTMVCKTQEQALTVLQFENG